MRAVRFHQHGGPDVLRVEDVAEPEARPGEVLVEVKASSLNHLDVWVRQGLPGISIPLPHVPGCDASGVVAELGTGVKGFEPGDRVLVDPGLACGVCPYCLEGETSLCLQYRILGEHTDGAWAERVALPAVNLHRIPEGMGFEEAAAVPLVFLTAWRMLAGRARVRPGEDVLVLGAGSGVGSAAVQIAKLLGARVFATASSEEKRKQALALGAEVALDYTQKPFDQEIRRLTQKRGVDVIVDHVGEATWPSSLKALARNGRLVTCGATSGPMATTDLRHVFFRQLQILGSTMGTRRDMADVVRAFSRRQLRPIVDSVFPFARAGEAMQKLESRDVFGKIVLVP